MVRLFARWFLLAFLIGSTLLGISRVAHADNGPTTVIGTRHDDVLAGGHGPDVLYGKAGDDHLWGGKGPDTFYGGRGYDVCFNRKGTGADEFHGCEEVRTT